MDANGDLPPLEWNPSAAKAPPAVMPKKPSTLGKPYGGSDDNDGIPFDGIPFESSPKPAAPIRNAAAAMPSPAVSAQPVPSAPAAAKGKAKRVELGQKGGFTLAKIERIDGDNAGEIICYELLQGKDVLARGTQDEVKRALAAKLSAANAQS